jgi:LysM repeat protein
VGVWFSYRTSVRKTFPKVLPAAGVKTMSTYAASFNTFNATTIPSGLNRRGRLARTLVVLSLAVILLAGFAFTAGAGDVVTSSSHSESTNYVVLTVGSGDSIWSIARAVADGRDVRSVVDAIVSANSLSNGDVSAGQKIRVPLA